MSLAATNAGSMQALRFGIAQSPITLDPRFATDAVSERICHLLYRKLVDFDARYQPIAQLATWEQLSPTQYRFTLSREGRLFHDGTRLTAADVKATYDFVLDAGNASPHRGSLAMIGRIEIPNAEQVDFHLTHADALFPGRMTLGIVPAHLIAAGYPLAREPVGSGPFRFSSWPDASRLILQRARDGAELQFVAVPNPTVRALKLVRGELDVLQGDMPPELFAWLGRQPRLVNRHTPGDGVAYLGFNMTDAVTGNKNVRSAIAHAIDRAAIIEHVFKGGARLAGSVLLPSHWAGTDLGPGPGYDPDLARRLLQAAGYGPDRRLRLRYKTSSDPFRIRLATILQDQLKAVGIDVELRSHDWGTFYSDIKAGRFQMFSLSWVGLKLPDIFRYAFHSASVPPMGANRGRYTDEVTDRLIESAEQQPGSHAQADGYRAIQARLIEELPIVPLWSEDVTAVAREHVRGYVPTADGSYDSLVNATWQTQRN